MYKIIMSIVKQPYSSFLIKEMLSSLQTQELSTVSDAFIIWLFTNPESNAK